VNVTYAALESIDDHYVRIAIYRAPASVRDGQVRAVALGAGKIIARYKIRASLIEVVPYLGLAQRHATKDYPAFDWTDVQARRA